MANIIITSTINSVKFTLGDYASALKFSKATRSKASLARIILHDDYIEYTVIGDKTYIVHYDTNMENALIIDSIDGAVPVSLDDLYEKLSVLIE